MAGLPTDRYRAFISHSQHDRRWAIWLQRKLEGYRVPEATGLAERRLGRVFRDRSDLASAASLDGALRNALAAAQALIVICSPSAAQSRWVDAEIRLFRELRPGARILALVVEGEPHSPQMGRECLPPALLEAGEPLAADARANADGRADAWLKIAAGLLGVGFDDLYRRQLRRRQRVTALVAGLALAGIAVTTTLAVTALRARDEALRQSLRAERVKDFMTSLFQEQDPFRRSTANARSPLQMVTEAAARLDTELSAEPQVRADLLNDLGVIELHLGALPGSEALLDRALRERSALYGADSPEVAQSQVWLAMLRVNQARYPEGESLARAALRVLDADPGRDPETLAYARLALAQSISFGQGAPDEAVRLFARARAGFEATRGPDSPEALRTLFQQTQMYTQARQMDEAEAGVRTLVERCRRQYGDPSAMLGNALSLLGDVLAATGRRDEAIAQFEQAAAQLRTTVGPRHTDLSGTLSHLAIQLRSADRLQDAEAAYAAAEQALSETDDNNRADILRGRGRLLLLLDRPVEAEAQLREAYELRRKVSGEANGFTWYLASEWGRGLMALGRLRDAEAIQRRALQRLQEIMGPKAYQVAMLSQVLAETLERLPGRRAEAEELRRQALQLVAARYPKGSGQWAEYAQALSHSLREAGTAAAVNEGLDLTGAVLAGRNADSDAAVMLTTLLDRAWFLHRAGREDDARQALDEAQSLLSKTSEPDPKQVEDARRQALALRVRR